jgi:hypothetical protein
MAMMMRLEPRIQRSGIFGGFEIVGNQFAEQDGRLIWVIFSAKGAVHRPTYRVSCGEFRLAVVPGNPGGPFQVEYEETISDPDRELKTAVLDAIAEWEREQEGP